MWGPCPPFHLAPAPCLAVAQFDALTLDLFGTLLDFSVERDEPPLIADLLDAAGAESDPHAVLETWMRASLADRAKTPFRPIRATLVRGARTAADQHGFAIDPERWATALEDRWAASPLHPDAEGVLDAFDAAGVPWAIVTNLDAGVLERVLANTSLGERSPVAVCSEHARAYKPHPRPFRMALERLGVQPGKAVHVGNRASEDRAGAHAAGMRCRLIDREEGPSLAKAVEAILAGGYGGCG